MDDEASAEDTRRHRSNLVGVSTAWLASTAFNVHPQALHIAGTREAAAGLFALLERSEGPAQAREIFGHYMELAFGLRRPPARAVGAAEARRWRTSYIKLLQGWGLDSNGPPGAVMKSWVESRFGLAPAFHKVRLGRFAAPASVAYLEEKAASRYQNNNIFQQFDLLYEFCQWMLRRHQLLGPGPDVVLWRGSTCCDEQLVGGSLRERRGVVRLNNLVSFSLSPHDAGCFGDWLFEVRVPLAKLLFVPGLVGRHLLQGEAEVLVIGGDFEMRVRYGD